MRRVGVLLFLLSVVASYEINKEDNGSTGLLNALHGWLQEKKGFKDVQNIDITPGEKSHRKKRFITVLHPRDCPGQILKVKYGMEKTWSSNYVQLCAEIVGSSIVRASAVQCQDFRITSPGVSACACCPWVNYPIIHNDGGECHCQRI